MRWLPILLLLSTVPAYAQFGPPPAWRANALVAPSLPPPTLSPPAVDGVAPFVQSTTTSLSLSPLTTTSANDTIHVFCSDNGGNSVSSISDTAGLTWTPRSSVVGVYDEYSAQSPFPLTSDTISVAINYGVANTCAAFGVSGENYTSPFDANGSVPSYSATGTTSYSTSNPYDLAVAFTSNGGGATPAQPAGFTAITPSNYYLSLGFIQLTSTVTGQSVVGDTYTNFVLVDAVQQ
jgi:hypothetical protein